MQQDAIANQQRQDAFELDVYKTDLEQHNLEQERAAKQQEQMYEYLYDKLESGVPPTMEEFASAGIGEDEARQILGNYGFDVNADGSTDGFSGTTYEEAMAYMRSHGVDDGISGAMMTRSKWERRKAAYNDNPVYDTVDKDTGEITTNYKTKDPMYDAVRFETYEEYLRNYVNSQINF